MPLYLLRVLGCWLSITVVVPAASDKSFTRNICFVVDKSDSMAARLAETLAAFRDISEQPVDELNISVVAFADTTAFWGWRQLPSESAVREGENWLGTVDVGRGTHMREALREALRLPKRELTIVVVTDGELHSDSTQDLLDLLTLEQNARSGRGDGRAVVAFLAMGQIRAKLRALAEQEQGGYYQMRRDD